MSGFFCSIHFYYSVNTFSIAAMAFSIAEYVTVPFYTDGHPPQQLVKCTAALTILIVAITKIMIVLVAIRIQVVFLVAKVLALTLIIIGGLVGLIQCRHRKSDC